MAEKKFFRVKLTDKCSVKTKIVNGITLTRQWQVKTGEIGDFTGFPGVEAQAVVKQGNGFIPAGDILDTADAVKEQTAAAQETSPGNFSNFSAMTVEQLKNYLIAKGVSQSELRNAAKTDLIERAEFIQSQNQ
jgi:hypothetical protein